MMETRILVPSGLRIIVTDGGVTSKDIIEKPSKFQSHTEEDDNEEKPSSSSGHCETYDEQSKLTARSKHALSCDQEDIKSWKKEYRSGQLNSSSSSSSLSPTGSESSSSENEAEIEYFMKNSRKLADSRIGSSNPFEYKSQASSTRNREEIENRDEKKEKQKPNDNHTSVKVCVARVIEKGTVFTSNDGDVQVVYLKGISDIPKDDIRFMFGCFETITPISVSPPPPSSSGSDPLISPASTTTTATSPPLPDEKGSGCNFVRLCNWIRFLRRSNHGKSSQNPFKVSSDSEDDAGSKIKDNAVDTNNRSTAIFHTKKSIGSDCPNFSNDTSKTSFLTSTVSASGGKGKNSNNIIARFIDGRPIFEVTERLVPGTELIAYFDMDSILSHAAATFPHVTKIMTNLPTMTEPTTQFTPVNIATSPPAPYYSSSSRISSSSPSLLSTVGSISGRSGGGDVKKDRDGNDLQYHQRQLPVYPYSFQSNYSTVGNNATLKDTRGINAFPLWQDNVRFNRKGNARSRQQSSSMMHTGISDGPLDLSKLPVFNKDLKEKFNEPLKVGTPFDSPDSNDDDMTKSTSPTSLSKSGSSSLFSIRNVLKHQASGPPSKLFQPYSLELGKKSAERDALLKALASHNSSHTAGSLITPPSSSDDPVTARNNATGLRPILRTRGRERSLLPCEVCGKAFDRPSLLKRHLRTHTGEKPHVCDVCSKGFSTSSSLNTHRRIHSGEKPHQCPICGKRFTASSNLYYHRMTHNKEKPHKCMLCGKSFPTPGDLKSHQYVHSGSWPYTCPVCHRGFSKQTNLRNHLLLHSGMPSNDSSDKSADKPHACQLCDKKFAQACNLRAHIKTHEESNPVGLSCCICKRTFHSSDMLVNSTCRNCLLSLPSSKRSAACARNQREPTSPITDSPCVNSSSAAASVDNTKEDFPSPYDLPSLLSHRMITSVENANQQPPTSSVGHFGLPLSQFPALSIPGLSNVLSFPANTGSLHFPMNGNHSGNSAADLFVNASAGTTPPTRNSLLEQIVEWNYRMAKESVGIGNLGFSIMQQKLLESRMLAAQFMSTHGFGMNGGMQDILGLRSSITSDGFSALEPVLPGENKFMPR